MNIENTRALVPVQTVIQPVKGIEHKAIRNFDHANHSKDRLVFIGNRPKRIDNVYGPLEKKV